MRTDQRAMTLLACVLGAAGVAGAAAGSHVEPSRPLNAMTTICLAHAPALLVLSGRLNNGRLTRLAAWILGIGAAGFALDMAIRVLWSGPMPGFAAPVFGVMMILGWLGTGVAELHQGGGGRGKPP